jgi:predicted Zn-dependent protease with MMP-like domain
MSADRFAALPAPSLDEFAHLAEAAFAALPDQFRSMAGDVVFHISDFPEESMLDDLGIQDPFELTGLYSGVDLGHRSVFNAPSVSPMVFLFRRPILDEWAENGEVTLGELITHVLVHEIGHHFGLTDEDIHHIESL